MAKLLRNAFLTSVLLLTPASANPDYIANFDINSAEHIVEKDNANRQIRVECKQPNLEELVLRTFIEEERENVDDEIDNIESSMLNLVTGSYSESSAIANKLDRIFKLDIPAWAFALQELNPKFFALQYGVQIRRTAKKELDNFNNISFDSKKEYVEYTNIFNRLNKTKRLLQINRQLINDVKDSTKKEFSFTNEEITDIKNALKRWDIKTLEILGRKKLSEYKELSKIAEQTIATIKETPEFKKYIKKISSVNDRISLYGLAKGYEIRNSASQKIMDWEFPVDLVYNSMHGPEKTETLDVLIKIDKTSIDEKRESFRIGIFSKNWKEYEKMWTEQYRIKMPARIWIIHPKNNPIENIVEKSYNIFSENDTMVGRWNHDLKKSENEGIQTKEKVRSYALNKIISSTLQGYIIKTRNIVEYIVWKLEEAAKISGENMRKQILENLKGYEITEIPIYPCKKEIQTAKYIRFSMLKDKKEIYALLRINIEKGTFDNLSYGDLEKIVVLNNPNKEFIEKEDEYLNAMIINSSWIKRTDKGIKINAPNGSRPSFFIRNKSFDVDYDNIIVPYDNKPEFYRTDSINGKTYIFADNDFIKAMRRNPVEFSSDELWESNSPIMVKFSQCFTGNLDDYSKIITPKDKTSRLNGEVYFKSFNMKATPLEGIFCDVILLEK